MLKKILIGALIAIGLVSGSVVRGQNTGGDKGQRRTTNEKHGRRRPTEFTSFTHIKQKRGRRRGTLIRKAGGEQERPLNPQPLPPGRHARRRGHRRHRRHPS
jgi:hypothetical protein